MYIYVYICIHICMHMYPNSWNLFIFLQSSCTGSLQIVLCWRPTPYKSEVLNLQILPGCWPMPYSHVRLKSLCLTEKAYAQKTEPHHVAQILMEPSSVQMKPLCGSASHAAASNWAFKRAYSELYWADGIWLKTWFWGSCLLNNSNLNRYPGSLSFSGVSSCSLATWALLNWFT